jgi:hypothetical protein
MKISAMKTKLITNSGKKILTKFKVTGQKLETVGQFKYIGFIITEAEFGHKQHKQQQLC